MRLRSIRNILLLLLGVIVVSCAANKELSRENDGFEWGVDEVEIASNGKVFIVNELRFYEINSAKDAMLLMFQNYGKWDRRTEGKYQDNIKQLTWESIDLFSDNTLFTIIADGTETTSDYFASLIVFDSNGNDCLANGYPLRYRIIELFQDKKKRLGLKQDMYQILNE
ncbi:hypothetical protein [Spongiivirga citrea]|uniref:Uncharacterized protein n=1 Tax=Spongiivirga citrea TaxID=1481457 RepID=A0A6M0CKM1_9FLAO|nr:hypothetical protein [Spongiivirga citrea]NER18458.1 hypothetical protein [Spongiivirga citrea]